MYEIQLLKQSSPACLFRDIALLHSREIPEGFLPTLGRNVLIRLYHHIIRNPRMFVIVAKHGPETVGFICGTEGGSKEFLKFLGRYPASVLWAVFSKLTRPRTWVKIFELFNYGKQEALRGLPVAELQNFCVASRVHSKGIGQLLFKAACEEFLSRGISSIRIVTSQNQIKAQNFYERSGAKIAGTMELHRGISSVIFTLDISKSD